MTWTLHGGRVRLRSVWLYQAKVLKWMAKMDGRVLTELFHVNLRLSARLLQDGQGRAQITDQQCSLSIGGRA